VATRGSIAEPKAAVAIKHPPPLLLPLLETGGLDVVKLQELDVARAMPSLSCTPVLTATV
jgi:hypothetical protein